MSLSSNETIVGSLSVQTLKMKWEIANYSGIEKNSSGEHLYSPWFHDDWYMILYPRGMCDAHHDYITVLVANSSRRNVVTASGSVYMLNEAGEAKRGYGFNNWTFNNKGKGRTRTFRRSYVLDPASRMLTNGALTIVCELSAERVYSPMHEREQRYAATKRELASMRKSYSFEAFLDRRTFSDVCFVVNGRRIAAHKVVLATRSLVFERMFAHDARDEVQIEGVECDVFVEMLRFLYSGEVAEIDEVVAAELLIAADRYLIDELKVKCAKTLGASLSRDSVLDYLILAETCGSAELKTRAIGYIKKCSKDVVVTPRYALLAEYHPELAAEVSREIVDDAPGDGEAGWTVPRTDFFLGLFVSAGCLFWRLINLK